MIYFTSDTHFWHKNVIDYCNRPASSIEEMNELLIERWNERIKHDDEVFHLGDFAFCGTTKAVDILRRLQGRKYWIRGNHDYELAKKEAVKEHFEWIRDMYTLRKEGQAIVLCHFPILSWDGLARGTWHLHGHCHGSIDRTYNADGLRMDVGVDTNNLYPYSYLDIQMAMAQRQIAHVDHHRRVM